MSILAGHEDVTKLLFSISDKWAKYTGNIVDPYSVAAKYRRKEIIPILKEHNIPGKIKYEFDQVSFTLSSRIVMHDISTGFGISFKEPFLDIGIIAGIDTKLWYTRVLMKDSEHLFHQYLDKSSVAYAGVFKDFPLTQRLDKYNLAVSASLLAGYSFGNNLKGTLLTPENKISLIPSVSMKMILTNITLSTGLEYLQTSFYKDGPLWVRIGISYNYYFDKIRTRVKPIKWY